MYRPLVQTSRQLRKNQTPHENKLWNQLRNRRFSGIKFRRQYVIHPYIVDFCCPVKKIIIELDGSGHAELKQEHKDQQRDYYLKNLGYKVIRVWNSELDENIEGVMEEIFRVINSPSP